MEKTYDKDREITLSIVIPQYNEDYETTAPLMESINNQRGIDFNYLEVIMVHDGPTRPDVFDELIGYGHWHFEFIPVVSGENKGPGCARQFGLDMARGKYVLFCDADDSLFDVVSLANGLTTIQREDLDVLSTRWVEEKELADGSVNYSARNAENTWMHGKFIRHQFILDNNLRFHDNLRIHEDSYFLAVLNGYKPKRRHEDKFSTYIWKYNGESITRRENGIYAFKDHKTFIEVCFMAFEQLENVNPDSLHHIITQFIFYHYFFLNNPSWNAHRDTDYYDEMMVLFLTKLEKFYHYYREATPAEKIKTYNNERSKTFRGGIEKLTVYDWLEDLVDEYPLAGQWLNNQIYPEGDALA